MKHYWKNQDTSLFKKNVFYVIPKVFSKCFTREGGVDYLHLKSLDSMFEIERDLLN